MSQASDPSPYCPRSLLLLLRPLGSVLCCCSVPHRGVSSTSFLLLPRSAQVAALAVPSFCFVPCICRIRVVPHRSRHSMAHVAAASRASGNFGNPSLLHRPVQVAALAGLHRYFCLAHMAASETLFCCFVLYSGTSCWWQSQGWHWDQGPLAQE